MAKRGRPPGPSPVAEAAYAAYAAMGPRRSLARLHQLLQDDFSWNGQPPPKRNLEEWSSKYHWQERVKEYDRQRVEERRIIREERIAQTNDEQYEASREMFQKTLDYARDLIERGEMGSQATVTLLKVLSDLQRLAVAADRAEVVEDKTPSIQIIIEQDNTPSPVLNAPRIVEAIPEHVETSSDED